MPHGGITTTLIGVALAISLPAAASAQDPGAEPMPIPGNAVSSGAPPYIGSPAAAHPIDAPAIGRHPFMAPNGRSNLHSDAFQSDTYMVSGPLGRDPIVSNNYAPVTIGPDGTAYVGVLGGLVRIADG